MLGLFILLRGMVLLGDVRCKELVKQIGNLYLENVGERSQKGWILEKCLQSLFFLYLQEDWKYKVILGFFKFG